MDDTVSLFRIEICPQMPFQILQGYWQDDGYNSIECWDYGFFRGFIIKTKKAVKKGQREGKGNDF